MPNYIRGGFKEQFIKSSAYNASVPADVRAKADAVRTAFTVGDFAIFKGPIKDNKGNIVIPAGTTLDEHDKTLESMGLSGRRRRGLGKLSTNGFTGKAATMLLPPVLAVLGALLIFGAFLLTQGVNPFDAYGLIWLGAFGTWFSWQNTLVSAAPLLLTGLCVALPAQMGLLIIGGEGAFVLGGLASVAAGLALNGLGLNAYVTLVLMAVAGMAAGGALIALCGILRIRRGVNETISSLLLAYISIAVMNQIVEGPMRDPASLDRPSTRTLPNNIMIGDIGSSNIHYGLIYGLLACLTAWFFVYFTKYGFAARVAGGNARAARVVGLPVERMVIGFCMAAGGARGSRRHGGGGSRAGCCQFRPCNRRRLYRHSRRVSGAHEPVRADPGCNPARRAGCGGRVSAAAPRAAGCDHSGAARCAVRHAARLRSLAGPADEILAETGLRRHPPLPWGPADGGGCRRCAGLVGRAAGGSGRRHPCLHPVPVRQPGRGRHRDFGANKSGPGRHAGDGER